MSAETSHVEEEVVQGIPNDGEIEGEGVNTLIDELVEKAEPVTAVGWENFFVKEEEDFLPISQLSAEDKVLVKALNFR